LTKQVSLSFAMIIVSFLFLLCFHTWFSNILFLCKQVSLSFFAFSYFGFSTVFVILSVNLFLLCFHILVFLMVIVWLQQTDRQPNTFGPNRKSASLRGPHLSDWTFNSTFLAKKCTSEF
jgi:hypothetical protein